ncbi:MAG: hypothetical protein AAGF28_12300 [Pseudomonadota bacterium]
MIGQTPLSHIVNVLGTITTPIGRSTNLSVLMAFAFLGALLVLFAAAVVMPGYGYDLVPYMGAVFQANGLPAAQVHEQAWSTMRGFAPPEIYAGLANGDDYRKAQSGTPAAFESVLPLYSVKLGYIWLLQAGSSFTTLPKFAVFASHIAGFAMGLTALFWMARRRILHAAPIIFAVLMLGNYFELLRNAGPDIIASAFILIGLWLWSSSRDWAAMAVFLIACLFRPDTFVLLIALTMAGALLKQRWFPALVSTFVALAVSVAIAKSVGHPGWWTHYYFSNVTIQNTLVGFAPSFEIIGWAKGMARGIWMSLTEFNWPYMLIASLGMVIALAQSGKTFSATQTAMILAMVLTVGGKFLLFPLPDERLYTVFILALALTLFEVWRPNFAWANKS